jgi:glycosyltransferase involved in cell wall biosynthesis
MSARGPLRILHVIASLARRYGGPPQVCLELCGELARRGARVSIYTTDIDGPGRMDVPRDRPQWIEGVEVRYFPVQSPRRYVMSWPLARALREAVPAHDVAHLHSLYLFPPTIAAHYCRRAGVPYLVRPHGTLDPYLYRRHRGRKWLYERLIERRNLERAAALHFTTSEEAELTRPLGLSARPVVVAPGVHLDRYQMNAEGPAPPPPWPARPGRRVVLFLGRLNFKKGLDLLARAFGDLARRRRDVHLVLAGPDDDGYGATVRRWLAEAGVLERCTIAGMQVGAAKLAALHRADVFTLPSYSENFGVTVVEAMACGLPVVVSDRVNIWREIAAARAGLVVAPEAGQLGRALAAVLDHPDRAAMGARGRQLVAEQFTWAVAGERMLAVYEDILDPARREPDETVTRAPREIDRAGRNHVVEGHGGGAAPLPPISTKG